ncbi:hypothetical protein JVT61DRAFT_9305 [Boletus reticuloceps]|uniref:DUF7702 domain-containing protein n=1 Tax=Boletus reticuloceps TaxID=495285 RepID=A0A8I2YGN5_9AGAM|nr:hypothetical protein JVT61DRAFT_9305 [Boletus reticuloceps]
MSLNTQGIISAVIIAIYIPIFLLAIRICSRYGIKQRGWLLLVIFSLIRIVGGALLVAAELIVPAVTGLYIGGYALEASGLSPLLLSTLGLLEIITEGPDGHKQPWRIFRILHLVGTLALILIIVGISSTSASSQSSANTERRVGVLLFAGLYIVLVAVTVAQWANRSQLMKYRKQLLVAVTAALPFLAVRTLYSVLSTFSSSSFGVTSTTTSNSDNPLAKFNLFTGEWQIYVVMEVVMEYAVVVIYTLAGNMLHLDQDYKPQESDEYPLYRHQY